MPGLVKIFSSDVAVVFVANEHVCLPTAFFGKKKKKEKKKEKSNHKSIFCNRLRTSLQPILAPQILSVMQRRTNFHSHQGCGSERTHCCKRRSLRMA